MPAKTGQLVRNHRQVFLVKFIRLESLGRRARIALTGVDEAAFYQLGLEGFLPNLVLEMQPEAKDST